MPDHYPRPHQIAVFHYLRAQPGTSTETFQDDDKVVVYSTLAFLMHAVSLPPWSLAMVLESWMELATAIEFDFKMTSGSIVELAIFHACHYPTFILESEAKNNVSISNDYSLGSKRLTAAFDALLQWTGNVGSTQNSTIPVAYTVFLMLRILNIHAQLPSACPAIYRGHYVPKRKIISLEFYEHVISTGIADHPDCIFDTYHDTTIYDMFLKWGFDDIWDQILEKHGFDPDWVIEEDERRKRVGAGKTSTHDVSVGADASQALQVKKRQAYEHEE